MPALDSTLMETVYDVLIAGGGTAGTMAACAAAREGRKVLLLEREYALGGTPVHALTVPRMMLHIPGILCGCSLNTELYEAMCREDSAGDLQFLEPQMMSICLERMCEAYGVTVLYGCEVIGCETEGRRITSVCVNTVSGLRTWRAKTFIDCTGDAHLAVRAGCAMDCGGSKGRNQPMSLRFSVIDVDVPTVTQTLVDWHYVFYGENLPLEFFSLWREEAHNPFTRFLRRGVERGCLLEADGNFVQVFNHEKLGAHTLWFNCPEARHIASATDPESLTSLVRYGHEAALRLHRYLKSDFPGFENSRIGTFSAVPGVRESRRLRGRYILSEEDLKARRHFPDGIAQSAYPIDIHDDQDQLVIHFKDGEFYEIPYRSLCPEEYDNLLVAGRCLSATYAAQSSARVQFTCMSMGEAAGIGSAMSEAPCLLDGQLVRRRMQHFGATFA